PGTVLLSSRAPIGYLAITEVPVAVNQGFIAMRPRDDVSNLFMLFWCEAFREVIINNANGSTFLEITKTNFRLIPAVMPTTALMRAFYEQIRPIHQNMVANVRESRTLAQPRDGL
ncbi:restriction endonuclease subunit S, partial [Candidatus Poribacteria bacterium]|nr:restriction endonuclease subunit S [Candidatus Poribacteria bacterium]